MSEGGVDEVSETHSSVIIIHLSGQLFLRARTFVFQQGQGPLQVLQSGRPREGRHPKGPDSPGGHGPRRGGQRQAAQVLDDGTQQNVQEPFNECSAWGGEDP